MQTTEYSLSTTVEVGDAAVRSSSQDLDNKPLVDHQNRVITSSCVGLLTRFLPTSHPDMHDVEFVFHLLQ